MSEIDYEFWKFVLAVMNFFGLIVVGAYTIVTRKSDQNANEIEQIKAEQRRSNDDHHALHDRLKERVVKLEGRPLHEHEIVDIHKRINTVAEGQKKLEGRFDETSEAVKRLHDYMINRGA